MFVYFRERGKGGKREREQEREGERENIDQLTPVHALTGDRTHRLLVYGMMLQPTDPPGQGTCEFFIYSR